MWTDAPQCEPGGAVPSPTGLMPVHRKEFRGSLVFSSAMFIGGFLRETKLKRAGKNKLVLRADDLVHLGLLFVFQIDPINLLRALQPALSVEPSRLLPTVRVVQLIEEVARAFMLVQPHSVSAGVSSIFASSLCDVYAHLCFEESWRAKAAGCLVLIRLLRTLPPEWAQRNLVKIAEAAFFVSKDATAPYAPVAQLLASECLLTLFTVAFCGYAGPVRLPFLQLAFGLRTSPLWRDRVTGAEARQLREDARDDSGSTEQGDVEMMDAQTEALRKELPRGSTKTTPSAERGGLACETDLGCNIAIEEEDDGSECDQYREDTKRFVSFPSTFLRNLRLAAEGVVFRMLSSSSRDTSEADMETAERFGRTLVPPPIPESDPVSYRSRRSRPPNTPWWMKRSEWLTWQKLNGGAESCSTISKPVFDGSDGMQRGSSSSQRAQDTSTPASLSAGTGHGDGVSGTSRGLTSGQSLPDQSSPASSHVPPVSTPDHLPWRPAEELRPAVCRILEKLLIPNLYQVRTECRRLGQRLFLLLPRLLGTDAAALLGGTDENFRAPGGGGGGTAGSRSPVDQPQNSGRNGEGGEAAPRSSQDQTTGAPGSDPVQQADTLRRSDTPADRSSSRTGGERRDGCTLPLPVSALTRVLKWVTLRPVALLTLQWQVAFLDCICFLAALRPAPQALRPVLEKDPVGSLDQTDRKVEREQSATDSHTEEGKREARSLATSAEPRESAVVRERSGSVAAADPAGKEAASVVCWLIEDALAVLSKGLETEAACFPSPLLLSVADEEGGGSREETGALPGGLPAGNAQQQPETEGSSGTEKELMKEGCEGGSRGDDEVQMQKDGTLQRPAEEEGGSRSQREEKEREEGSDGGNALAGGGSSANEGNVDAAAYTANRIVQAALHAAGATDTGRGGGGNDAQSASGNNSGGIVIDEAYTSVSAAGPRAKVCLGAYVPFSLL